MVEIKPNSKDFKILQLSNSPFSPSGYGVQSALTLPTWNKHYTVRQLCNYGIQGRAININGLLIYPCLPGDDNGGKTAPLIFANWKPDVFVTLYDLWMGAYNRDDGVQLQPIHPFWVPVVMVDHEPIPEATLLCAKNAYKIISPTRYAYEQFAAHGVETEYIPLGVDNSVYKPTETKAEDRKNLTAHSTPFNPNNQKPIEENNFLITMVGANKDPYRKNYGGMFTAIKHALDQCSELKRNLRVYVHSWMRQARDIPHAAKVLHIDEYCRGTRDYDNLCGVSDSTLSHHMACSDVFLHLSQGGGFEVPMLEALSCGLPLIASDFICMSELVHDHGWPIPVRTKYLSPLDAMQGIVDEYVAADAIVDAYKHPDKRASFGKASREFALNFDYNLINDEWLKLFEEIRASREYTRLEARKL
jgi:glycosyltransferase involved in cell wall biosynthesis